MSMFRTSPKHWRSMARLFFSLLILFFLVSVICAAVIPSWAEPQEDANAGYWGKWEYQGSQVHFTFVLKPDGTGHLADEVDTFPFVYSLNALQDPASLDLPYQVWPLAGSLVLSFALREQKREIFCTG